MRDFMAVIGQRNSLRILHAASPGLYLDGGEEHGEILLPRRYIKEGMVPGSEVDVFVYHDSENRRVATTEQPKVMVGQFACLQVVGVEPQIGAFLDWGLSKDLLLPVTQQDYPVKVGDWVVVYVCIHQESGLIIANGFIHPNLNLTPPVYEVGQKVNVLVFEETPLGFNAIIENAHLGLFYRSELSVSLYYGQQFDAYIKRVRPDTGIDLRLDQEGYQRVAPLAEQILEALHEQGGKLDMDDDSSPEAIREVFGTSKKAFKQAIGALYRERKIELLKPGIRLVAPGNLKK